MPQLIKEMLHLEEVPMSSNSYRLLEAATTLVYKEIVKLHPL